MNRKLKKTIFRKIRWGMINKTLGSGFPMKGGRGQCGEEPRGPGDSLAVFCPLVGWGKPWAFIYYV